uniref:Transmembrane protein 14C n=1 Tax=Esox lucius TaxID=8010 RepID=A0AAY5L1P2_ESOLU
MYLVIELVTNCHSPMFLVNKLVTSCHSPMFLINKLVTSCHSLLCLVCLVPGSVPSLAAGLLFGGLAGVGAYQISQDPQNIWVSLVTSGALAGVMGKRFYSSRKVMPAGLMAALSILMVGKLGVGVLLQKPHES